MNAIALVDCNNFFASCERVFDPTLVGRPVVVLSDLGRPLSRDRKRAAKKKVRSGRGGRGDQNIFTGPRARVKK